MSSPLEAGDLHRANEPSAQHQNPLQAESDALRKKLSPRAGHAISDFVDGLDGVLASVPDWAAAGTGVMLGVLSRGPAALGVIGKFAALPYGLAFLGDLGSRLTGMSRHSEVDNQRAYQRDALALGSLGAGLILGGIIPKCRSFISLSKASQFETKDNVVQFTFQRASENLPSPTIGHMPHSDHVSAKINGVGNDNLIYLNRRAATFGGKEKRMITDEEIAKFGQDKQEEIRKEMELLIKSGRPKEFLDLWPDGSVSYNSQAHQDAILLGLCE